MVKIATHDSSTAERPYDILSWLMIPFARTQSKTIAEQYAAGCRSFDIRIRKHRGIWHCAHGLYITKRTATDILTEINRFPERCQVQLTYEGVGNREFEEYAKFLKSMFHSIIWGGIAYKYSKPGVKVEYHYIAQAEQGFEGGEQGFVPLDGRSWHTYLPIPWLWDRLYTRPHKFNEGRFTFVDFL